MAKRKRARRKGQRLGVDQDEVVPVVSVSDHPEGSGGAAIIDYAALCKELYPAYLERIKAAEASVKVAVRLYGTVCTTTNGVNNKRGRPIGQRP